MIKKYFVEPTSVFHQSIILPLYEKKELYFHIEGLTDNDKKDLFPLNLVKINKNNIETSTKCVVVYLDENLVLKALILISKSKKYYLFKVDHQKERQLNIHQKYISNNINDLMDDYEKHLKVKGKSLYDGEGDFNLIKDINYLESRYQQIVDKQIDQKYIVLSLMQTTCLSLILSISLRNIKSPS